MTGLPATHKLKTPVEGKDGPIEELTVRRMTAGDLLVMDREKGDVGKVIVLLARITGHRREVIEKLDGDDFGALADLIGMSVGGKEEAA